MLRWLGLSAETRVHIAAPGIEVILSGEPRRVRHLLNVITEALEREEAQLHAEHSSLREERGGPPTRRSGPPPIGEVRGPKPGRRRDVGRPSQIVEPSELDEMDSPYAMAELDPLRVGPPDRGHDAARLGSADRGLLDAARVGPLDQGHDAARLGSADRGLLDAARVGPPDRGPDATRVGPPDRRLDATRVGPPDRGLDAARVGLPDRGLDPPRPGPADRGPEATYEIPGRRAARLRGHVNPPPASARDRSPGVSSPSAHPSALATEPLARDFVPGPPRSRGASGSRGAEEPLTYDRSRGASVFPRPSSAEGAPPVPSKPRSPVGRAPSLSLPEIHPFESTTLSPLPGVDPEDLPDRTPVDTEEPDPELTAVEVNPSGPWATAVRPGLGRQDEDDESSEAQLDPQILSETTLQAPTRRPPRRGSS